MKRRDFLAAAAALLTVDAIAAPAKSSSNKKKAGSTAKPAATKSKKSTASTSKKKPATRSSGTSYRPAVQSAENSVVDNPPEGTSASRLPPVRPPELPSDWRTFEIVTTINLKAASQARTRLWLPLPFAQDTLYQRTLSHAWQGNPLNAAMRRQPDGELEILFCDWRPEDDASLRLTTHVTTADRHFDVTRRTVAPERDDILRRYLQSSRHIPNEGLSRQLGERIVGRIKDPVAQAKAIYDWVVENSIYDPTLPGCGTGDINKQLINGRYGGRSADINGMFVSLCRSIGIPARTVQGLRVGRSRLFQSLGLRGDEATRAQHVRAEFYIPGYGWIPVDPSDVRRAMSREVLSDTDSRLISLKRVLFGVWEMNWIALNIGSDVRLPDHNGVLPFLLHPRMTQGNQLLSDENPATTPYTISARQVEL